eukprot:SM000224S07097  [mRNA]  locus=s224:160842:164203:+ [translate_table: standard]
MPAAAFASDIFGEASFTGGGSARSAGGGADSGLDDDDIFGLGAATSATEPSYSSRGGAMADGLDDDDNDIFGLGATSAPPPPPPPPAASASAFDDLLAGVTEKPDANGPRAYDDFADPMQQEQPLPQPPPPPPAPAAAASVYEAVETQESSIMEDIDGSDMRGVPGESRSWRRYAEDEWITVDDYVFRTMPSGPPPRRPPPAIVVEKKKQASRAPPPPPSQKLDQKPAGSRSDNKSEPKTTRSRSEPTREKRKEEADAAAAQQQQRKDESGRGTPPSSERTSEQEANADLKRSESAAQAAAAAASAAASAAAMKEAMERAQRKAEAAREARERERLREKAREREREQQRDKELEKERELQRQRQREQEQEAQATAKREREQAAARANDGGFADFFNMPPPSSQPSRTSSEPRQRPPQPEPAASRSPINLDDLGSVPKPSQPAGVKKSPSAGSVDDWTNILGGSAAASDVFQEVEGEPPERRKARMEKHQRMQDRLAAAINEKNQRDLHQVREQAERQRAGDLLDAEIKRWAAGKEGNLRALLSTLQYVLWPECNWTPVSLTDVIEGQSVKKVYRRATLVVHPDKVQQKGATIQQKYIAEKVFDLLKEAWNKFNSEELF